jgi:tripartite-type tricarboxylate transporter receptor subunit TctC
MEQSMRKHAIKAASMVLAIGAAAATGVTAAATQTYPDRVVQIIVPSTPGASADILGRVLADGLSAHFGKPFIVVNKAGAMGVLGTADVARANPDGYTLFHGATYSIIVEPLTDKEAGYTFKSFTPICQTFKNDQVVVVQPGSPLKTARDLVEAARKKPGLLNVGVPGVGTIPHIAMVELEDQAKVEYNLVQYKGTAEEVQAVRSKEIDFAAVPLTVAAGSGLAMPGIFAEKRNPAIPGVPTFKEQGYDIAPLSIGGLLAPAGTPSDVVHKLENACIAVTKGEAAQRVVKNTFQPEGYFADAAGFAHNLAVDVAEKNKLVPLLKPH